jgi:hypothetical protein
MALNEPIFEVAGLQGVEQLDYAVLTGHPRSHPGIPQ